VHELLLYTGGPGGGDITLPPLEQKVSGSILSSSTDLSLWQQKTKNEENAIKNIPKKTFQFLQ